MADRMDWFPFHAQDFLTSRTVLMMSDADVGRYVKLLAESWIHGPLPKDMEAMGRLIRLSADEMAEAWKRIEPAFVETDEGYVNPRLEETRKEQELKRERRRRAGRKGAQARWTQEDSSNANGNRIAKPMRSQSDTNGNIEVEEEKKKEQTTISAIWDTWIDELGGDPPHPQLSTGNRRKVLTALYREHLADRDDPVATFRAICQAVKASDHHMSQRSYHLPESLFRNEERRERWTLEAVNPTEAPEPDSPSHHGRYVPGMETAT